MSLTKNGHRFPYDIFKFILTYQNFGIWIQISMKFVAMDLGPIDNNVLFV